jgi:geranylgeranyl pyrophosphate synthase
MPTESLTKIAINIIDKRGKFALDEASRIILQCEYDKGIISGALKYYAQAIFPRVLPIFPALIYLSCKAVGGKPEKTKSLAAAMMLVTASGDIHDDIIDKSTHKFRRKTVLGKYRKDVALLAGDALLIQGATLLQNNYESLSVDQRKAIADLINKSMFELVEAEATETRLWKKADVTPQEYFEVIRQKGSIAELHCKIGGIIGCADEKALEDLTDYGRVIGILSTVKDEFMDMLNFSEFQHRINNEMPPYPMLYAFQNKRLKKEIMPIITKTGFSKKDLLFIANTILNSVEVKKLKAELRELGENELTKNPLLKDNESGKEAAVLLQALAIEL